MSNRTPALLTPFEIKGFRFLWTADLLTASAIEMEVLILGWYMLVKTGSVVMLTALGAMQYTGTLVAPMFGVFGDRIGHRRLLCLMRAIYAAIAATICTLSYLDMLNPVAVLLMAGTSSLFRTSDIGMRGAVTAHIMPADRLMRAMGIARTTSDAARAGGAMLGAALFGLLGMTLAYLAVTVCHTAGCLLTLGANPDPRHVATVHASPAGPGKRPSPWRDLRAGLAYIWRTPHLNAAMWLACLANLTTLPLTSGLLPYVAREVYRLDQNGLGMLVASYATGALVGSLGVSIGGGRVRAGRVMITWAIIWHMLVLTFPFVPNLGAGMLVLASCGFAQSLCMVPLAAMLLRTSDIDYRGRVMGVRMLAINSLPFGLLIAGALIRTIGFPATIAIYALTGLALTLAILVWWRSSLLPLTAPANGG